MLIVSVGPTTVAVSSSAGIATACSRSDCAVKAAAMAMAPLMPVPATRQMTVL